MTQLTLKLKRSNNYWFVLRNIHFNVLCAEGFRSWFEFPIEVLEGRLVLSDHLPIDESLRTSAKDYLMIQTHGLVDYEEGFVEVLIDSDKGAQGSEEFDIEMFKYVKEKLGLEEGEVFYAWFEYDWEEKCQG